ncbi:MAG: DEAD/DEAH box helicase [Desulfobacterales bacterium]|jgi:ATP-dependent RNA helicase RhlB|nr:DEAD/DEAH box helicase [Desulfobacterales bacterium]
MLDDSGAPGAPEDSYRAEKPDFLTAKRFDDFGLPGEVLAGLKDAGFEYCTPIQAQALPVLLQGRDVAGQAQTGTGKTAAFLVTVLSRLLAVPERKSGRPQALIMAPTRELSRQIYEEALALGRHTDISFLEVVGGIDYREQADSLSKGVDIVIGTPGRIIDYYKQGVFKTQDIKFLVIDEADRLLDLGFEKDMRFILRKLPHFEKRQSMLFSATLSHRVLELTYEFMNLPEFIAVTPETVAVEGIEQSLFHIEKVRKFSLLLGILKREEWSRILIFVNMKMAAERLARKLKANGLPAEGITGDLPQRKRFQLMERFKSGHLKILVATDVASRGIHVEDISHVVNYDLPQDAENYVHRIGRTARAGKSGKSISFACEEYVYHLEPLEEMLGYKIPVVWPEEDWFAEDRSPREESERRERRGRRERPERPDGRRGRERGRERPARERPGRATAPEKPKKKRVPGAFFGFGPPEVEEDVPQAPEGVQAVAAPPDPVPPSAAASEKAAPAENGTPDAERPKKRRRRRRKKKPAAAEAGNAEAGAPATAAEPLLPPEPPAEVSG